MVKITQMKKTTLRQAAYRLACVAIAWCEILPQQ